MVPNHPTVALAHLPTPLEPADRWGAALGLEPGTLWVKRDDCTGLAGGGNKARKLDYLCADAIARGCDTLVTGGGRQSNHVRMTAAAANKLGLACALVLGSDEPGYPTGNVVLDYLLGAELSWVGDLDYYGIEKAIEEAAARLEAGGRRPYVIPIGGASTLGALSYFAAAHEVQQQLAGIGAPRAPGAPGAPRAPLVIVADGSGGTHAGLVAGFGDHGRVVGVDVGTRPDLEETVPARAAEVARAAGAREPAGQVQVEHGFVGAGYGAPTDACRDALELAARTEGLILDPVYTGKAAAALAAGCRDGWLGGQRGQPVVFWHTGGMPALFADTYAHWIRARR